MKSPYLSYIISNLNLYEYADKHNYKRFEIITYKGKIYLSLTNNNKDNNPINSIHWINLV